MYSNLREAHVRCLHKWGLLRPVEKTRTSVLYSFSDLAVLRHVSAEIGRGVRFRTIVRGLAAERDGQMVLDFRPEPRAAGIVALRARTTELVEPEVIVDREAAEVAFALASALDNGDPGNRDAAASAYRKALQSDPYLIPALINLGNLHYGNDELVEAEALYERALLLAPDVYEAHFNLGNVHHDLGRLEAARGCYEEALRLNPDDPDAHFYLAVTLEKMGRSQEAKPHWRAYQRLAPDGEWIDLAREFSD